MATVKEERSPRSQVTGRVEGGALGVHQDIGAADDVDGRMGLVHGRAGLAPWPI
jgi:hypothetical protein